MPNEGCNRNVKRDPRACGACNKTCKGAPCVDGACTSAPAVLAKDAWGYGINTTDGTYLYLGQPNDTSTWTRVKIKDGTVESKDDKQQFAPAAFDGKFLYGCKGAHKEPRPPCELKKREGDGPETMVVSIQRVLYGKAIAVKDGTLYWARAIPNSMKEGRGPFADIVAMDLATKTEAVIAANEQAPLKIVVDDAAIYWVSSGIGGEGTGVRKLAKKGGGAIGLAILPVASSLDRRGEFVLATSVDGLFRVPAGGGAADLVLQGAPASVKAQFPSKGSDGIAVVGDEVYWTTAGKDVMFSTVLHATL